MSSLKERLDALTDAPKVATEIGNIIGYYRSESSLSNMYQNIPNVKKEIDYGTLSDEMMMFSKLRPSYENPTYKQRAAKQDKFNADATVFLEDTLNTALGNEDILPLLITVPAKIVKTAARKEHIVRTQEALVEKGFESLAPLYEEILTNLQASIKRKSQVLKLLKGKDYYSFNEVFASMKEAGATDELLARIGFILSNQELSRLEKIGKIESFFQQEDLAMILRRVHDSAIRDNITALANTLAKVVLPVPAGPANR